MLFVYLLILIITFHLATPFETSCSDNANHDICLTEADPGLFVLSQFWIPSQRNKWIIHGLWINYCNGSWIEYCPMDPLPTRNITKLLLDNERSDLVDSMNQYWNPDEDRNALWLHELEKHGSCMRTIQPLCYHHDPVRGWITYFDSTIQLYLKYPIFDVLKANGVVPGYYYPSNKIKTILLDKWNTTLSLQCENDVFTEVFFYFHAVGPLSRAEFIPAQFNVESTCSDTLYYPLHPALVFQK